MRIDNIRIEHLDECGASKFVGLPETSLKLIDLSLTINVY